MNEEISHLYAGISSRVKAQTIQHFKQSPRILDYLQLLEKGIQTTPKLVAQIYAEELPTTTIGALTNRFYKLRSRVHVWLLTQMQYNQYTQTAEQQKLTFFRLLVTKNEHLYVLPRLKALLDRCWNLNLFELLPEVIELTIRAGFNCEELSKEEHADLAEQLQEANQLLYILHQIKQTFHHLYLNIENYQTQLNTIRRLIKPYKGYPRLELLYRYVAFSMGVHRKDLVDRTSGAMIRHLNAFYKLKEQHHEIPIRTIEPFHEEKSSVFFYDKEAVFWYQKKQLKKCVHALKKRQTIIQLSPNLIHNRSASNLHNAIYFCTYAKNYQLALDYVREFETYQDNNPSDRIEAPYFVYEMIIYVANYSNQKHPNPFHLIKHVRHFLYYEAAPSSAWIILTLVEFALLYERSDIAVDGLDHPYYTQQVETYAPLPMYTTELIQAVDQQNVVALNALIQVLKDALAASPESKIQYHYETTLEVAEVCAQRLTS